MISFIAQRIAKAIVVLLALVVLNFFLIRMAPGDPALVMAGEAGAGDQVFLTQLREKFGLDQPLPVQLFLYVKGILSLDLGFSFRQQMPVATLILQRLPATLLLTGPRLRFRWPSASCSAPWRRALPAPGPTPRSRCWRWSSTPRRCSGSR
jgi:peptide/nickel transport system permease protein